MLNLPLMHRPLASPCLRLSLRHNSTFTIPSIVPALAAKKTTPLLLKHMYLYATSPDVAQRIRNAQFLHNELPIRFAQRIMELDALPAGLGDAPTVKGIIADYCDYVSKIISCPRPTSTSTESSFTSLLRTINLSRVDRIKGALKHLRETKKETLSDRRVGSMDDALENFFLARVGLRFLCEHHIASATSSSSSPSSSSSSSTSSSSPSSSSSLSSSSSSLSSSSPAVSPKGRAGLIDPNVDPIAECNSVSRSVEAWCLALHGQTPKIEVFAPNLHVAVANGKGMKSSVKRRKATFTYVPSHFNFVLGEVLKNAVAAVVRTHGGKNASSPAASGGAPAQLLPPIKVVVAMGSEDVSVKVSDQGGGMPRSLVGNIWTFAAKTIEGEVSPDSNFGLPLARIHARYFGGDLTLKSMEGFGVDAYLHVPVLGDACENLPLVVEHSPGNLDSTNVQANTWAALLKKQ